MYLRKIFPHFSRPLSSRFSELFYELSKIKLTQTENITKTEPKNKKLNQNLEKCRINPEKILNGLENRTSIIIKNIPNAFGGLNFYKLVSQFSNEIKFFYIPGFEITKWEYIYAFVTIGHIKGVLDIYEGLNLIRDKFKIFNGHDFSKIEIYFCRSQCRTGIMKKCHKEIYPNSIYIYK